MGLQLAALKFFCRILYSMETLLRNTTARLIDYTGSQLRSDRLLERIEKLAYCITDSGGHFVEVNDAYCAFYGYSREELLGNHFTAVVPEEFRGYLRALHDQFIAGADEIPSRFTVKKKNGDLAQVQVEAVRVEPANGDDPSKLTILEEVA